MDQKEELVKITIDGKLKYEELISLAQAGQIVAFIDTSSKMETLPLNIQSRVPSKQLQAQIPARLALSPAEAIGKSGAKTNPQKIVVFGSLILDEAEDIDKDFFVIDDIKPLFRRARQTPPKNLSRDLSTAIQMGWIAESETGDEYFLTQKGLTAIENGFSGEGSSKGTKNNKNKSTNKKARKRIEIPDAFKDIDELPSSIKGVPDYLKLNKKKDKFLWALYLAKTIGITELDNKELTWLTDKLGDGIKGQDINAYYKALLREGFVNRTLQSKKLRIMPSGEDMLKNLEND